MPKPKCVQEDPDLTKKLPKRLPKKLPDKLMDAAHFRDIFCAYVGYGQTAMQSLALDTGIPLNSLKNYQSGLAMPGLDYTLRLMRALPAAFTNQIMQQAGLQTAPLPDALASDNATPFTVARVAARLVSFLNDAVARRGGVLRHGDLLALRPVVRELASEATRYLITTAPNTNDRKGKERWAKRILAQTTSCGALLSALNDWKPKSKVSATTLKKFTAKPKPSDLTQQS